VGERGFLPVAEAGANEASRQLITGGHYDARRLNVTLVDADCGMVKFSQSSLKRYATTVFLDKL